ncbi:MAG: HAD family hydrolase [Acidimicrobiales bacterium]
MPTDIDALLFDFFGTLVTYQPDRSQLGYPASYELAVSEGFAADYESFVGTWDSASHRLEATARETLREFSMADAARAFADAAGLRLAESSAARLGDCFVGEWAQHITAIDGLAEMLQRLARSCSIAVVSNTHDSAMVPNMLAGLGVADLVSVVVLSVDHGWQKPHASIYQEALTSLDCSAERSLFIGDSYEADYVGPRELGMRALLIDPENQHAVVEHDRLSTVLDLEAKLGL